MHTVCALFYWKINEFFDFLGRRGELNISNFIFNDTALLGGRASIIGSCCVKKHEQNKRTLKMLKIVGSESNRICAKQLVPAFEDSNSPSTDISIDL
jgi:hypothetical protein